jgi:hypothetical protein
MARAITAKYEELVLEVETDVPGTYTKICGMNDATISRAASIDSDEIPDCDDESLPFSMAKSVRSLEVSVSASGVWAQSSNKIMSDWFYSAATKNIRVRNTKAASGDPETEAGPALLSKLEIGRTKGKVVTADIEIQFDGTPTRTNKA